MRRCSAASATPGRAGEQAAAAYLEWCDPDPPACAVDGCEHGYGTAGCSPGRPGPVAPAMPALGRRITEDIMLAFRQSGMPPDEFSREFLGWWEDPADSTDDLTGAEWAAPRRRTARRAIWSPPPTWHQRGVVVGGGVRRRILELVEHRRGTSWLPERLAELRDRHRIAEIGIDPAGPAGSLLPDLERAGAGSPPRRAGHGPRVRGDGDSRRRCGCATGEPALMAAVGGASRRTVGDGWKWSRKDSTVDVSPLVAATYAHWMWLGRAVAYDILDSAW